MDFWDFAWIGWLAFMAIGDVVADRKKGATFSEHCWQWFGSAWGRIILAVFLVGLYLHLAFHATVWPVVGGGALVVWFIARWYWRSRGCHGEPVG